MVRLANGTEINPGIISHFYDTRSDTPVQLQQLVQDVLNGGTMSYTIALFGDLSRYAR